MITYIERLNRKNRGYQLINTFENELINVEVQYTYENCFYGRLVLRKKLEDDVVVRVYHLTDFTCDPINDPANLDYRSALEFSDSKVRKIYITFMNRTFSDYKEAYLNETNFQARKNLGDTM